MLHPDNRPDPKIMMAAAFIITGLVLIVIAAAMGFVALADARGAGGF